MNNVFTLFLTFLFSLSLAAKSGRVEISGKVINPTVKTIEINHLNNRQLISAKLDSNGSFNISTKVEDGYYLLQYGRSSTFIYLYPKDEMKVNFDAKHFENTIVFSGEGAVRNNYLVNKAEKFSELTQDLEAFYKVNEDTFLENIENVKKNHIELLSNYKVENFFKEEERKSLEYERLLSIQNYESSYKFYLGEEITPSTSFYDPLKNVELENRNDYIKQPYYRYLVNSIWSKRIDSAPNVNEMLNVLRKVSYQDVAISLVNGFYSKISSKKERAKDYLDLIKRVTKHKPFIEAAEKKYQEVLEANKFKKGSTSPIFEYENLEGNIVALNDLKGNYVYIDVWATWCAPCIKQIPYLKNLEKRYHDKNIVFVSISVDKEKSKDSWRQMVKDKELSGIQLFADNSFDSEFMDALAVNSIPRFILIDPDGNILNSEAPSPSYDKTKSILDELLN